MDESSSLGVKELIEKTTECLRSKEPSVDICIRELTCRMLLCPPSKDRGTSNSYMSILKLLLDRINSKWFRSLTLVEEKELVDSLFLKYYGEESYLVLMRVISEASPSHKFQKALGLLEEFLTGNAAKEMFVQQCAVLNDPLEIQLRDDIWAEVISYLISLPERVANKVPVKDISDFYRPAFYFATIAKLVIYCLEQLHARVQASSDVSLQFLSRVVGRSCLAGHSDMVLPPVVSFLTNNTASDFIWRRVAHKLFSGVPDNSLEVVYTFLMRKIPWYKMLSRLIGNALIETQRIRYLATHKLLLIRCFDEVLILQNIMGYLADDASRRHLLIEVIRNLLEVWGNKSNLKHRPYTQHLYITKAILIGMGHMTEDEKKKCKEDLQEKLVHAMDSHLSSSSPQIRNLGMYAAKCITKAVNPDGPQLQFECERNKETEELEGLMVPPQDPGAGSISDLSSTFGASRITDESVAEERVKGDESKIPSAPVDELDSDDDLEPYDMSHDSVLSKRKKPLYLRDCMEGLLEQEDPDRMELCLKSADDLIRGNPLGLEQMAAEVAKILLCIEDKFSTENFVEMRHRSQVAVTVACPKLVADYLCEQFYERNYNLRQRLDILEVLVDAAKELSSPKETAARSRSSKPKHSGSPPAFHPAPMATAETWKTIIEKRIASKTRRFGKGCSKQEQQMVNRFAPVAGHFVFPLLHGYRAYRDDTLDLLGGDFIILGRLIYSLGAIVHAAINAPVVRQMGQALLEFLWTTRYHTEPYVRKATIFALCMIVISVPSHFIVSCLQESILNYQEWLKETMTKDLDAACVQLAGQALILIDNAIKEELTISMKGNVLA